MVDASGTAGVRGVSSKWTYDASGEYGHNSFAFTIGDTLNVSLGPTMPPNKTAVRRRHARAQSVRRQRRRQPAVHRRQPCRAGQRRVRRASIAARTTRSTPASRTPTETAASPNQFGGRAAIGAQVFPGFRPSNEVDASRNSVAGYVDVEGDVIKWLRLGLAGRAEHYSDFGRHARRQADGARPARSALRLPRLDQHRLPRAVARPVVLLVDGDELREPRVRDSCRSSR